MNAEPARDPVADVILALIAERHSISMVDAARAFAQGRAKPADPADAWRRYLPAVRQQAVHLARAGTIAIRRKGKVADPNDFKGVVRLTAPD